MTTATISLLNEVLSLNAQEYMRFVVSSAAGMAFLNEVLSLNAQEFGLNMRSYQYWIPQ